jgi:Flp pilus assembly protein TadB
MAGVLILAISLVGLAGLWHDERRRQRAVMTRRVTRHQLDQNTRRAIQHIHHRYQAAAEAAVARAVRATRSPANQDIDKGAP